MALVIPGNPLGMGKDRKTAPIRRQDFSSSPTKKILTPLFPKRSFEPDPERSCPDSDQPFPIASRLFSGTRTVSGEAAVAVSFTGQTPDRLDERRANGKMEFIRKDRYRPEDPGGSIKVVECPPGDDRERDNLQSSFLPGLSIPFRLVIPVR